MPLCQAPHPTPGFSSGAREGDPQRVSLEATLASKPYSPKGRVLFDTASSSFLEESLRVSTVAVLRRTLQHVCFIRYL